MKFSDWCKKNNVPYSTAYDWFKKGKIPNARRAKDGSIVIYEETPPASGIVIYCRVSGYRQKEDLIRQIERCKKYAISKEYAVDRIYQEIDSGMNDDRKEFWHMIDSMPAKIIIENRDRLTRFGFNYIERLLKLLGCSIEVVSQSDDTEQDLVKDLISLMTSFCGRLNGIRSMENKLVNMG